MQRRDEQCIAVVKIENPSFFFQMDCFLGARFQFFFFPLNAMNIALVMTAEVAMNIVFCLVMLCSGSPECASATNSKEDPLPRYFIKF